MAQGKSCGQNSKPLCYSCLPSPSANLHNNFPLKICAKDSALIRLNFRELAAEHSLCGMYCDIQKNEADPPKGAFFKFVNSCGSDLHPAGKLRIVCKSRLMKKHSKKILNFSHILIAFLVFLALSGILLSIVK